MAEGRRASLRLELPSTPAPQVREHCPEAGHARFAGFRLRANGRDCRFRCNARARQTGSTRAPPRRALLAGRAEKRRATIQKSMGKPT
jgi:hypothetical protein